MRFRDLLRVSVLLFGGTATALAVVSVVPVIWRSVNAHVNRGPFDLMANSAATSTPLVVLFITAVAINVCLLLVGRERLGNQLARAAITDELTGTLNRSGYGSGWAMTATSSFPSCSCSIRRPGVSSDMVSSTPG